MTLWYYPLKELDSENYPLKQRTFTHSGDVTEIKFLLSNHLVVSSSYGSVNLLKCNDTDLSVVNTWENLHYFKTKEPSSCTALACFEEDVASVGEDGRIALLTVTQTKPVGIIGVYTI